MAHILHIDASARGSKSNSRTLGGEFVKAWLAEHPGDTVTYRDVGQNPVPHITEEWIDASFVSPEERTPAMVNALKFSDTLIDELLAADRYVFSVPMYNFNVPSSFKAYIDNIVRYGRTYGSGWKGLVQNKKMLIVTSRGGVYLPGTPMAAYDQQEPFLRTAFGYIGITDVRFIHAQGINMGEEAAAKGLASAREEIRSTVKAW